ncbi:O-antigen acetylase [Legionella wadsworthii]|uniref:O-antigen acetylase n=2 Tax=Legionella wadsworthii TaxID=28088 RepID=A0A378LXM0_9GAMM|nr:O-antigen acetylase [Legionella wadsworthii]
MLFADEFKQLGKHIAGGAGFVSNFVLWKEIGYFDNSAETKPLLHLWSLGIEEQFYIVWPILLWLAWKCKFNLLLVTVAVASISFWLNLQGINQDSLAAFYSPQNRFWELLCGSLLGWLVLNYNNFFLSLSSRFQSIISFIGFFLLIYGFWHINKNLSFPGTWALIPTLGAVFIIAAGPQAWINRQLLSHPVMVWFGLISFPLYLWHWPLLSFLRIVESGMLDSITRITAVLLSIILAWVTFQFVERKIRFGGHNTIKMAALVPLMVLIGCAGYATFKNDGFSFRTKEREQFIAHFENSFPKWKYLRAVNLPKEWRGECAFFNGKKYRKDGQLEGGVANSKPVERLDSSCYVRDLHFEKSVLIWGDSHAQALSPGIVHYIPNNWQVLQVASSGCAPNPNVALPSTTNQCAQSNYFAMETIRKTRPDVVLVAQAKNHSIKNMEDIGNKLHQLGVKKILFLGPTPQWTTDLPKIIARQLWLTQPKRTQLGLDQKIIESNKQLLREFKTSKEVQYVDVIGFFCNEKGCLTHTDEDIKSSITTWDYGHLTPNASRYLGKNFLIQQIIS